MIRQPQKRFYKQVEVAGQGPYAIALDGKPVKTPLRRELALPTRELAEAVAAEWAAQGDVVDARSMWMTKLANTALDRVAGQEPHLIGELEDYAGSDLVCYRAADPESLVTRQGEFWDPVLAWAEETFGVRFLAVQGIVHRPQPEQALTAVSQYLQNFDPLRLCAIHNLTTLTGSLLIALAVERGDLEPERAWLAAYVDEDWQAERWGKDEEAAERRARRKQEFDAAVTFLKLLAPLRQHPL